MYDYLHLATVILFGLIAPVAIGVAIIIRRYWLMHHRKMHALHVRVLRSELLQAMARGSSDFLIAHWTKRDRAAALDIGAQLLGLLRGRDRQYLEEIFEKNRVLERPLLKINRRSPTKRIAMIRRLSAFGNKSVQGTLHAIMLHDPNYLVRLEAALAICVAGQLPPLWQVIRSTVLPDHPLTPNHYSLFRSLVPTHYKSIEALAVWQDEMKPKILAIDALGFAELADFDSASTTLALLVEHELDEVAEAAQAALDYLNNAHAAANRARMRAHKAQHPIGARLAANS